jgi:hypothetical protein
MEEQSNPDIQVQLGFLEDPLNSYITQPKFLPSKVGGKPVSILLPDHLTGMDHPTD